MSVCCCCSSGGRCVSKTLGDGTVKPWSDLCSEECDIGQGRCDSAREVYFANVGTQGEDCVDMKITNETEYRCARARGDEPTLRHGRWHAFARTR